MAIRPETQNSLTRSCIDLSKVEVSEEERLQLMKLFEEFSDRISRDSYDLGSYAESEIVIKTTTEIFPTKFRPSSIPVKFQKELDEHINKLLSGPHSGERHAMDPQHGLSEK